MKSLALIIALLYPGVANAHAQTQVQAQVQARDARPPAQTGSAIIRGRITAAESDRPLRRAHVRLTAPELGPEGRTTSTGVDGRYEIKYLPAGRYTIQVTRSGYLQLSYGQRRPLEQGRPLQIADKQVVERIDFALPKTSVITGRVTDELGEPVSDTTMFAMRQMWWQGRRRLTPAGIGDRTDDAGGYRISGLVPGTYFVDFRASHMTAAGYPLRAATEADLPFMYRLHCLGLGPCITMIRLWDEERERTFFFDRFKAVTDACELILVGNEAVGWQHVEDAADGSSWKRTSCHDHDNLVGLPVLDPRFIDRAVHS